MDNLYLLWKVEMLAIHNRKRFGMLAEISCCKLNLMRDIGDGLTRVPWPIIGLGNLPSRSVIIIYQDWSVFEL